LKGFNMKKSSISNRKVKKNVLLKAALQYAALGWKVFPLRPKSKTPALKRWPELATSEEKTIREWWEDNPRYNIGIATGKRSGIFVFDIDLPKGGGKSLRRLLEEAGEEKLPHTAVQITAHGNHSFCQHPGFPVKNSTGKIAPGVDIRGDGGYIVVAPSIHPDTEEPYQWREHRDPWSVEILPGPDWLIEKIKNADGKVRPPDRDAPKALGKHPLDGFDDGERDVGLRDYAWRLMKKGLPERESKVLLRIAARKCRPPFDKDTAIQKAESAWKKAEENKTHIEITTAPDLMKKELPPTAWVVDNILPEGCVIVSAKPRAGKSTLARDVAVCVASGELFAGHYPVKKGSVLYLSLEENERKTQGYLRRMLNGSGIPKNLEISFNWSFGIEAAENIRQWIDGHKDARLVVIDVLQRVRMTQGRAESA
jgi:hypothetical protein